MIEGNFCRQTCKRCPPAPAAASLPGPSRASGVLIPSSVLPKAPAAEVEPVLIEESPEIAEEIEITVQIEDPIVEPAAAAAAASSIAPELAPAAELEPLTAAITLVAETPLPLPQTEPTPAQEEFLQALASEAAVLASAPPAERDPTVERLPALTLDPPREEEPRPPSIATIPRAVPVQSPPTPVSECNTTSAWDALSSDPQLTITTRALETLNLKEVLQNPEIRFTVSRR